MTVKTAVYKIRKLKRSYAYYKARINRVLRYENFKLQALFRLLLSFKKGLTF